MADIVRNVMEETGISVTDLILFAIDIAHLEHPSELVSHRDEIIQSLYVGVRCAECNNIDKDHVVGSMGALVIDETQDSPTDQGKAIVSSPSEVVAEGNNDKEQPSEKRTGLKVVIRLKKIKNLPVPAEPTEAPKSDNCKAKSIKSSNGTGQRIDQLQNLSMEATEGPESKMDQFQNIVPGSEEYMQRFQNAKRKLRDSYEMAACAKKQRTVKLLSTKEVPKQGACMLSRKGVVRTQLISSTSNVGRGKVLPKHHVSKLQMLRKTFKSRF